MNFRYNKQTGEFVAYGIEPMLVSGIADNLIAKAKASGKLTPQQLAAVSTILKKNFSPTVNLSKVAKVTGITAVTHAVNAAVNAPINLIKRVPVVGTLVKATQDLANLPVDMASQLAADGRLDKVALGNFKRALGDVKAVAPYVQVVVSMVPGVGQGLSGAIGASLALASGASITDAMTQGVQDALPGGPAARAAFKLAHGIVKGEKIDQLALDVIPIPDAQKKALTQAIGAVKDIASGKKVSSVLVDQALQALPPDVKKAVQTGVAMAHAATLQEHAGKAQAVQKAVVAADHVVASLKDPKTALQARAVVTKMNAVAKAGDPAAKATLAVMNRRAAAHKVRDNVTVHPQTGRVHSKQTGQPLAKAVITAVGWSY